MNKGLSANSLMAHIRDKHGIDIRGSKHKSKLMTMGYYHGYKGYRFCRKVRNRFNFHTFDEIIAVYEFDLAIKSILYTPIMMFESVIKNYIIDELVSQSNADFESIYSTKLAAYKNTDNSSQIMQEKLKVRKDIHDAIHFNYPKNPMIENKINKNESLPLWIIFEILTLNKVAAFTKTLNDIYRVNILKSLSIYDPMDTNGAHLYNHMFILNDLRNGVAHDHIIFDCRFRKRKINNTLKNDITTKVGANNIHFTSIADYFILILIYLKSFGATKTERRRLITSFENEVTKLDNSIPKSEFHKILGTDIYQKIQSMKNNS